MHVAGICSAGRAGVTPRQPASRPGFGREEMIALIRNAVRAPAERDSDYRTARTFD
jgi:hypothetical protein